MKRFLIISFFSIGIGLVSCDDEVGTSSIDNDFESALLSSLDSMNIKAGAMLKGSKSKNDPYGIALSQVLAGYYYRQTNENDTSFILLSQATEYLNNSEFKNTKNNGRALFYLSSLQVKLGDSYQAKNSAKKALKVFQTIGDHHYSIRLFRHLAVINHYLGIKSLSLKNNLLAYKLYDSVKLDDDELKLTILESMSVSYLNNDEHRQAIKFANEGLRLATSSNLPMKELNISNTIGSIYSDLGQLDTAVYHYNKVASMANSMGVKLFYFVALNNIANQYYKFDEIQKSDSIISLILNQSSDARQDIIAGALLSKAKNNLKEERFWQAIHTSDEAYEFYSERNYKSPKRDIYELKWKSYESLGYLDSAFKYKASFFELDNEIKEGSNDKQIINLRIGVETLEKQNEINQLKSEADISSIKRKWLVSAVVSLAIILVLIFINFRSKVKLHRTEKNNLRMEVESSKKTLQAQAMSMIRLKNNLEEIQVTLKDFRSNLKEGDSRIKKVLSSISFNNSLEKEWDIFNKTFIQIHNSFYETLKAEYPELSISELRMCALIRLNMTNHEISSLLNIESKSVTMAKYRLKKKLQLSDSDDLRDFIFQIEESVALN